MKLRLLSLILALVGARAFGAVVVPATKSLGPLTPGHPLPHFERMAQFEGEADFGLGTGKADAASAYALWQDHDAGDLLASLRFEGERGFPLPNGVFQWSFRLGRGSEPVQFTGSPVFRLSVWDVTSAELVAERSLHASDFSSADTYEVRALFHSTAGREGHRFEPRVRWESYVDGWVDWVTVDRVTGYPHQDLEAKAILMDDLLQDVFLDPIPGSSEPGLLVARRKERAFSENSSEERGDSATWLSYYTAAQALRLEARPLDSQAQGNLERGFRALHALHQVTGQPGVIARYADPDGNWRFQHPIDGSWRAGRMKEVDATGRPQFEEWARSVISEDVTTAFCFAVGVGYAHILDPGLKRQIGEDLRAVARHFLQHDFAIVTDGRRVDLNPYLGITDIELESYLTEFLSEETGGLEPALRAYDQFRLLRDQYNQLVEYTEIAQLLTFGCIGSFKKIPEPFLSQERDLVQALSNRDKQRLKSLLPTMVPELYGRIFWFRDFLKEELRTVRKAFDCVGRLPNTDPGARFSRILSFADLVVTQLDDLLSKLPPSVSGLKEIRFHAAHAIASAHLLGVARSIWPEEFGAAYERALFGAEKRLLWVMETWDEVPEVWATLIGGDQAADKQRSSVRHRSFLALWNLIRMEKNEGIRAVYRRVFEHGWKANSDEGNAFYEIMRQTASTTITGNRETDLGVAEWGLALLPVLNTGVAKPVWDSIRNELDTVGGGVLDWDVSRARGRVRDPLPPNLRSGQMFLWQRNPREVGYEAESEGRIFPSVDYLLPYWMARASGLLLSNHLADPKTVGIQQVLPTTLAKSSDEIGLSIGRGTGLHEECKTRSGFVSASPELERLEGPYGPISVPRGGLNLPNVRVLMGSTDNEWKLTINPQPEGVQWSCQVCRDGGIEKPGSAVNFRIDLLLPARSYDRSTPSTAICTPQAIAKSGEQGVSLGSGLLSDCKTLHFRVALPPGVGSLGGTMGRIDLGGDGYEDSFVRVRVLEYHRVESFSLIKFTDHVEVEAQICRPDKFRGGAEIKISVELRLPQECPFALSDTPALFVFSCEEGQEAPPQTLVLHELSDRIAPWFGSITSSPGPEWLRLSESGGYTPAMVRVAASAIGLRASDSPYSAVLRIEMPGSLHPIRHIPCQLTVQRRPSADVAMHYPRLVEVSPPDDATSTYLLVAAGESEEPPAPLPIAYVDWRNLIPGADGTIERPYREVRDGYARLAPSGVLRLRSGRYSGSMRFSKPLRLEVYDGSVLLGGEGPTGEYSPTPIRILEVQAEPGRLVVELSRAPGTQIRVLGSLDLRTWTPWKDVQGTGTTLQVLDPDGGSTPMRFFKIVTP